MIRPTTPDLDALAADYGALRVRLARRLVVCAGTGCVASGSLTVHARLAEAVAAAGLPCSVELKQEAPPTDESIGIGKSGCQGFCQQGPLVAVEPDGVLYCKVQPADVDDIVAALAPGAAPVERLLYRLGRSGRCRGPEEIPFYQRQSRTVLASCGHGDPDDVRDYVFRGGYRAAQRAWTEMEPAAVVEEITASGLRGRGGGGFPTGRKWQAAAAAIAARPEAGGWVVCNGDEGDPGAFMDRSVMEGDPHTVLEGMLIAARAVGADRGMVYVRTEYPLAVTRLRQAVAQAEAIGVLGRDLFGTGRCFTVEVMEGAGAFVCGEETAMIASIQGGRGMPMPKPPFPAERGLFALPTVINNVETLASVPGILRDGAQHYRSCGTGASPGTKTFALTGHVLNTGLIEVPFGTPLREIVMEIGGGVIDDRGKPWGDGFKAVQIGGPSGGCLTREHLDLPLDFDSLRSIGAMVGSGGLVVMNANTCMVQVARFFMQFTQNESCGKCTPCREGTRQMLALLDDIIAGRAGEGTLMLLESLARTVAKASLCGLGKTAPNPVLSTLRWFRAEYEAHVLHGHCPAGRCKALTAPAILAEKCKGCSQCIPACPVGAITGERKQVHLLDAAACLRCGACASACRLDAIVGVT